MVITSDGSTNQPTIKFLMKRLKQLLAAVATTAVTLFLDGNALAQKAGGTDVQNMDQKDFENMTRQNSSSPERMQAALEQFQNMSPEQQQAAIARFQNLDPQLQQATMQQVQNVAPQMQPNAMPQFQGMDPQQIQDAMQQRINDSLRDQMGVTNDTDWALIEEKINAVEKAQMAVMADSGMAEMMSLFGMGGGRRGGGFLAMLGRPGPESDALRQAIDSDAPRAQIKTLTAKLRAVRQEKLTNLAKAQEELRALLTTRQEAVATMAGLFN
jgi:hypothetical protein